MVERTEQLGQISTTYRASSGLRLWVRDRGTVVEYWRCHNCGHERN